MDPYLEAPGLWPDFHHSFLAYARETLQPLLPDAYCAQLRTREEIGIAGYRGASSPEVLIISADEPLTVPTSRSVRSATIALSH